MILITKTSDQTHVCVVIPFILDVRHVDVPAGVTQHAEGHTGFLRLFSAVLAIIFLARRMKNSAVLSLISRLYDSNYFNRHAGAPSLGCCT